MVSLDLDIILFDIVITFIYNIRELFTFIVHQKTIIIFTGISIGYLK
jgi:hypothetical protein